MLRRFGSLSALSMASPEAISSAVDDPRIATLLIAVRAVQTHILRLRLEDVPILSTSSAVADYLFSQLAHLPHERVHVLYLDRANRLLRDETAGTGGVSEVTLHTREILRRALELGATALVLAHNHPSGRPAASPADLRATRQLGLAAAALDIKLHDHLVIAANGLVSFRAAGWL